MANFSASLSQKLAQLATLHSKNVGNLNTQENAMSAKEMRGVLGTVIKEIVTDLDAVSTALSKDATGTPQSSDLFWQMLHLCIDDFPDSLVEIVHRVPTDNLGLTGDNVKNITCASEPSQAFTVWVLSRIIRFLSEPGCIPLHNKAISAVLAIMQLIKSKDLVFYKRILTEFVALHRDLAVIEETVFGDSEGIYGDDALPLTLDHFQFFDLKDVLEMSGSANSGETKLTKKQIMIHKEEDCALIHEGISEIMCQVVGDVCHYANKQVNTLWRTCCLQLETGVSAVKQFGFTIITNLLTHGGLPVLPVLDHFIRSLCAVIDVITSGACQSSLSSDTVIPLEKCLATCLGNLFGETSASSHGNVLDSPWSTPPPMVPVFVLPAWHMNILSDQLCTTLESGGLGKLLSVELKSSLCSLTKYFYCHVPNDYCCSITTSTLLKHTINKALVHHVGMETDQQYMVGCLYQAISNRESCKQSDKTSTTIKKELAAATSTQIKSPVIPCKKPRKSSVFQVKKSSVTTPNTNQHTAEQDHSTLALLSKAMDKFMNDIIEQQHHSNGNLEILFKKIEGVRISLEVVARSASTFNDHLTVKQIQSYLTLLLSSLHILVQAADTKEQPAIIMTTVGQIFKKLVDTVMLLFYVSESVTLPSELQQCLVFVVSIPWLYNVEQPWTDLPHSFGLSVQTMTIITKILYSHIDKECKGDCLQQLAMFTSDVAPTWRSQVFMLALQDPSADITVQAIKWLPTLLCSLGSFSYSLVPDNLQKLLSMGTAIQKQVGMALGPLACVLTEHALVKRWVCPSHDDPLGRCIGLYCPVCDKKEGGLSQHAVVDAAVFTPYLHLLSPTVNSSVKLAFISSIPRICTHLATTPNTSAHSCIVTATCCDLIEDPDYHVRLAFSKVISHVTKPGSSQNTGSPPLSVMTKLKKAFNDASTHASHQGKATRLQETVVLTIGQLGTTAEGEMLLVVIISLLKSLTARSKVIRAKAFQQIREIANCRNKPMNAVFSEFKQAICKFVVDAVHDLQSTNPTAKESLDVVTEVASVFEYRDIQSFLTSTLRSIIPHLVKKATLASSTVLRLLAKELQVGRREMLLENFKYIFSFLVRTCSPSELEKALGYVQKETDVELGSLLRSEAQSVYNQLLLYLSVSYDKVFSGLSMLASKDDTYTGPKDLKTSEHMGDQLSAIANFLQHRLLGILAFYNTVLVTNSDLEEKKLALQSLVKLMEIMGPKYITSVRVKVMGILRLGLRFKDTGFPELSCDAWECFVHNIELSCLGPLLSELVVTLLPYLNKLPSRVAKIYHFLIIENKAALSDYFHEIYFLPDTPELKKVNAVLRTACGIASKKMDLKTQLKRALKGVVHENLDVRRHALSKLKQLLHDNQTPLHDYVLSNDTVDPIIPEIVSVLISRCRETDPESKILVAECLGELGAVDPGRLDELRQVPVDEKPVHENGCEDMEFAEELITELARAFLTAHDTRAQDCSAYAIQEVLQVYECTETKKEGLGFKLWRKFPEHIQEILRPHLYSKYLSSANPNWSRLAKPIYRTAKGKTFSDWASTWTSYMITKVKEGKPARIFQACSKIFKHDIHTALFLLPHVIMYALLDGTQEDLNEIHTEIMSVLAHVQGNEDLPVATSDFSHMSAQTIFSALDYLNRWTRKKAQSFATRTQIIGSKSSRTGVQNERESQHEVIQSFLQKIPQDVLASASFNCKAYTRALMHFEAFINNEKKDKQEHLGFLQEIYVALDEPDGVVGVSAIRNHEVTLHQQILEHENSGKLRDASACYESAIQEDPNQVDHHKGLLNCLMGLGQVTNALMHSNGTISQRPEWKGSLNTFRVEAAWRLGQWDSLANFLKMERGRSDWNIGVGRVLLAAKEKDEDSFNRQLRIVRSQQMGPLSTASMESGAYQRGYEYIARLHMLRELESCLGRVLQDDSKPDTVEGWKSRLQITQKSFRTREQILNLRRAVLNLFPSTDVLKKELGESWLQSAKIARKEGHVQAAFSSLLNASVLPQVCIERAKWMWSKGDPHQALLSLQKSVSTHWGSSPSGSSTKAETDAERLIHAKAMVLEGRWMEETAHYEPNPIIKKFREVTDLHTNWESGHFYIGKYYDRLMVACLDEEKTNKLSGTDFIPFVIKHYGTSLQFGNKFIYQSMPRLLTIWLDFGAKVPDQGRSGKVADKGGKKQKLMEINKLMVELTDKLPAYQFLTTFSLLISRICHPNQKVVEQLEEILAKLLVTYPQQAMWMMMAVSKSSFATRVNRCHNIFHKAKKQSSSLGKFIDDATRLADRLLEVCNKGFNKNLAKDNKMSMSHDFNVLKRLISDGNFSPIIVPLQSSMTVTLPSGPGTHVDHNPFPDSLACIIGFDDTVEVLTSLQRPKKITVKGSDGKSYIMMCKPKDDLRKDSRTMEFNALINKCLRKDPESRRRQLHIRTYAVIPLNEECGLVEWVKNTYGLRNILYKIYKEKNMYIKGGDAKKISERAGNSVESKVRVFTNELLPKHPPVFHEWFLKSFPNPTSWYQSRVSYCRTIAVMSMVGYILGLGDRHGENILFDSTNGDCVHVDLNCLFNKGETFDCPERVPFRLTHNIVNAMGLLGYEGVFRRSCEVTLRLMREQCDSLLTVLCTFIYDPLVEWQKIRGKDVADAKNKETGEATNEEAVKIVKDIEQRLKGFYSKNRIMIPLSIEGQVHKLITEATDIQNLAQMYIGWAAYL